MSADIDLLVHSAGEIATPLGSRPLGGARLAEVSTWSDGAVAVHDGRILATGISAQLRSRYRARRELDASGCLVVPGFVDAHTHPVFAGTREDEFEQRTLGASYLDIAAAGGGILSSVRAVRSSSKEELLRGLLERLDRFLELGTTTIEAKSGYGLSREHERKCLEVIGEASAAHPVRLVPTFLGAHGIPPEARERRSGYMDALVEEMLPEIAERGLARYCDVFTERGAFDLGESRRILERARALGLGLRIHADQLTELGGAELAAELGAASADHLEFVGERGIEALAGAGVIPVLCPLVPLYLRQEREAPARRMIQAGLAPALSTDFNPGSCPAQSLPLVMTFAALRYRLTAAETLACVTLNAACSLGLGEVIGTLEAGKRADLVVLEVSNLRQLVCELGRNAVRAVVKDGRIALERTAGRPRRAGLDDRGQARPGPRRSPPPLR